MSTIIKINNNPVEATTLAGLSIRYGRQEIDEQVPASTCTVSLLAKDTIPATINVRDLVTVEVDGTTVFYGKVTDRTITLDYVTGAGEIGSVQQIIAAGVLADLGRYVAGTSLYPEESDGARAARIITEASPAPALIDDVATLINLTSYSYDTFGAAGYTTLDAGSVTLTSRAASPALATTLVNTDPFAPGIYETADGRLGYADAFRRIRTAVTPITIPASNLLASLSLRGGIADVVNSVTITYGTALPPASTTVTAAGSILKYGTVAKNLATSLLDAAAATDTASRIVEARNTPDLNIEAVTIELSNPALDPTLRAQLLGIEFSTAITLTGLDPQIGLGTSWTGFIEGWTLNLGLNQQRLTLNVSAEKFSVPPSALDRIVVAINNLTGTIDALADLWATEPNINQVATTINTVTATYDTAYLVA